MAYEFKKLSDVEEVETFPENGKVLLEDNGKIKKCPVEEVEEFPEDGKVLFEDNGKIKKCPVDGLGGGGDGLPDIVICRRPNSFTEHYVDSGSYMNVYNKIYDGQEANILIRFAIEPSYSSTSYGFFQSRPLIVKLKTSTSTVGYPDIVICYFNNVQPEYSIYNNNEIYAIVLHVDDTVSYKSKCRFQMID